MDIKDSYTVLTGATGGIGRELAKELDSEGSDLILISKSEKELRSLISSLTRKTHVSYACDLSNQEQTVKIAKEISEKFTTIKVLINAAGIGIYKPLEDISIKDFTDSLNINLTSEFIFCKNLLNNLKAAGESVVINIGSGDGVIPVAGRSVYCTTKFAIRGMTLSFAEEFKRTKTHFCLITLGSTLTSFGPLSFEAKKQEMESGKGYLTPEWVAKKLVQIVKDDNKQPEYEIFPSGYNG